MSIYDLPKFNLSWKKKKPIQLIALVVSVSIIFGFLAGTISSAFFYLQIKDYLEKLNILPSAIEKELVEKETIKEISSSNFSRGNNH